MSNSQVVPIFAEVLNNWMQIGVMPVYKKCPGDCGTSTPNGELCSECYRDCQHPTCNRESETACECGVRFCSDHGSVGGDVEGDENSLRHAVPSACWKCGGFDVDSTEAM